MGTARARAAAALLALLAAACGNGAPSAERLAGELEAEDLRAELAGARRLLNEERERAARAAEELFAERSRSSELEAELALHLAAPPLVDEATRGPDAPRGAADRDVELARLRSELAADGLDASRLESELLLEMEELVLARERLAEGDAETARLRGELAEERELRAAAERDLARLRDETSGARAREDELREETVRLTVELARLERLAGELRAERDAARGGALLLAGSLAAGDPAGEAAVAQLRDELAAARNALSLAEAELARTGEDRARRGAEVAELERELALERARRLEREEQWLDYIRFVDAADLRALLVQSGFPLAVDALAAESASDQEAELAPDPGVARAAELRSALRALLAAEEVRGLDLLELSRAGDGWAGPVVIRLLDDRGRLAGGLYAERLSLEASRAGRTLTLVLREGYESRGGRRYEFEDGVRRVVLPDVDPADFIAAAPELFPPGTSEATLAARDDGRHDLGLVRAELNRRLHRDAAGSVLELRRVGGIADGVLRDVHLVDRDRAGRLLRDLLADRLSLVPAEGGVELLLEDGVSVRDGRKASFLDGRMRIVLPLADAAEWSSAGLPLAAAESTATAAGPGAEAGGG